MIKHLTQASEVCVTGFQQPSRAAGGVLICTCLISITVKLVLVVLGPVPLLTP